MRRPRVDMFFVKRFKGKLVLSKRSFFILFSPVSVIAWHDFFEYTSTMLKNLNATHLEILKTELK